MGTDATSVNATDRYDVIVENYEDGRGRKSTGRGWLASAPRIVSAHRELRAIPVSGKLVIAPRSET